MIGRLVNRARHTLRPTMRTVSPDGSGRLLVIGDSFASGVAMARADTYPVRLAAALGFRELWVNAQPGTGFASDAGGRYRTYGQRIGQLPAERFDLALVQGSTNDAARPGLEREVRTALQTLAGRYPSTRLVLTGQLFPGWLDAAQRVAYEVYRAVAADLDVAFIDPLGEGWFSGTGSAASPTGDGTADRHVLGGALGGHPSVEGAAYIALRLAEAMTPLTARASSP